MQDIITSVGGAVVGGVSTGWICKTLIQHYFKKNEDRHESWSSKIGALGKEINGIGKEVAVIQTKIDNLNGIKTEVAVLKATCERHKQIK